MKKLFHVVLSLVMALSCSILFVGCGSTADATTRLTAEINPKVEFMLDKNDKVVSVTGLNEEGELIISGEAFVGKTADEAIALFVEISTEAGYLVKGSVSGSSNELDVSISGDTAKAQALFDSIKLKVDEKLTELGVVATVEKEVKEALSELKETLLEVDPLLTATDVANLTEEQVIKQIAVVRKEAKDIVGKAAKDAYYQARAYEIKLAESKHVKEIIGGLNVIEQGLATAYVAALDALNVARKAVSDAYVTYFVAEDSAYQTALNTLLSKKQAVLDLRNELVDITDATLKAQKEALLTQAEQALALAEDALESAKDLAEDAIDKLMTTLAQAEASVKDAYNKLVDLLPGFKNSIEDGAKALDKALNGAKKNAFDNFEKAHGNALNGFENLVKGHKDRFNGNVA